MTLVAHVEGDGYPEFARTEFHLVIHGGAPDAILVDGAETRGRGDFFVIPSATFTAEFSVNTSPRRGCSCRRACPGSPG